MPFINEMKNVLLFVSELPEEEQEDIARSLSGRVVAYDYATTMTFDEVSRLVLADLSRTIQQMKRS